MDTKNAIVATLEVIKFNDDFLEVVRVAAHNAIGKVDGEYWVSVRKVCENLNIDYSRQQRKLKSDPTFEAKLIKVQTRGGMQDMFCIPLEKLNGWLFTINPNKVKPEVKEKLITYKNECFKVLYNHFLSKAVQSMPCPASDNLNTRITGYKGMLARKQKELDELRFKLAIAQDELKTVKKEKNPSKLLTSHHLLDLSGELARHNLSLARKAEELEYMARDLKRQAKNAQMFLDQIVKHYPKAKKVADTARLILSQSP